jgi:hypothetical protein
MYFGQGRGLTGSAFTLPYLSHEKCTRGFAQQGAITSPNPCTVLHKLQWKNYRSRLILQQNGSEMKEFILMQACVLKVALLRVQRSDVLRKHCGFVEPSAAKVTVRRYRNCEVSSPPCSLHSSHLLSSDSHTKYCLCRI